MIVKLKEDYIYLVGDTHSIERLNVTLDRIPCGSTVFQVGDCGISRNPHRSLMKLNKHAHSRDQQVMILRGNHDNPRCFPLSYNYNVKLLADYSKLVAPCGAEVMCVGGGFSIDRSHPDYVEGFDYWPDEITVYKPELCQHTKYLIMHDAPSNFNHTNASIATSFPEFLSRDATLMDEAAAQRAVIDQVTEAISPQFIFGGHFHNSKSEQVGDIRYRCLSIEEVLLVELNNEL